jgi:hypothetical protein
MSARRLIVTLTLYASSLVILGSPQARADSSLCNAVAGNLIQNCGFEQAPLTGPGDGSVPPAWTVGQWTNSDGVISNVLQSGYANDINSGSQALQIGNDPGETGYPSFNGAAILSQSFLDTSGDTLTFSFYLLNGEYVDNADDEFQAFFDSTSGSPLLQILNNSAPQGYTEYSYQVTGTGSDSITFTATNGPNYFYLDDVSVVDDGSSTPPGVTPEPSSLILAGSGMLALFGAARRRLPKLN